MAPCVGMSLDFSSWIAGGFDDGDGGEVCASKAADCFLHRNFLRGAAGPLYRDLRERGRLAEPEIDWQNAV